MSAKALTKHKSSYFDIFDIHCNNKFANINYMVLNASGSKLFKFLKDLDVENKWQKNTHIDWLSGKKISKNDWNQNDSYYTHCSAFVSSVCHQLNVPMLTPPKVRTEGLANRQYEWLNLQKHYNPNWKELDLNIWTELYLDICAQSYANCGYLVLMIYYDNENANNGHIGIVCPCDISVEDIIKNGIKICQAGLINALCIDSKCVFPKGASIKYWCWKTNLFIQT